MRTISQYDEDMSSENTHYSFLGWNPETMPGRCFTCGFFSKHATESRRVPTPTFFEIEPGQRAMGEAFKHTADVFLGEISTEPFCFRYERFFEQLIAQKIEQTDHQENSTWEPHENALRGILMEEIDCPKWYAYTPGMGPREHLEESRIFNLEKDRREWQERISRMEMELQETNKQILRDSKEILERSDRITTRLTLFIIGLVVVQIFLAVISLVFPHGISFGLPSTPIFP